VRQIVFALPLGKADHRHVALSGEAVDARDELGADRLQQRRRREGVTPMAPQERHDTLGVLQAGLIQVQVHAVDALHLQAHMLSEDITSTPR
jgi:hypothetical protein